jgi:hypothetical protein
MPNATGPDATAGVKLHPKHHPGFATNANERPSHGRSRDESKTSARHQPYRHPSGHDEYGSRAANDGYHFSSNSRESHRDNAYYTDTAPQEPREYFERPWNPSSHTEPSPQEPDEFFEPPWKFTYYTDYTYEEPCEVCEPPWNYSYHTDYSRKKTDEYFERPTSKSASREHHRRSGRKDHSAPLGATHSYAEQEEHRRMHYPYGAGDEGPRYEYENLPAEFVFVTGRDNRYSYVRPERESPHHSRSAQRASQNASIHSPNHRRHREQSTPDWRPASGQHGERHHSSRREQWDDAGADGHSLPKGFEGPPRRRM